VTAAGAELTAADKRTHFLFVWPCGCPFSVMTRHAGVSETNAWIEALETDERVQAAREAGARLVHITHRQWCDQWQAKFEGKCGHETPTLPPVARDRSDALGETDHEGLSAIASGLVLREGSELWVHIGAVVDRLRPDLTPFDRREVVHEILRPLRRVFDEAFN
jgi:hypothetical protein